MSASTSREIILTTLPMSTFFYSAAGDNGNNNYAARQSARGGARRSHFAGYSGTAYFGYINPGAQAANIRPAVCRRITLRPGQPILQSTGGFSARNFTATSFPYRSAGRCRTRPRRMRSLGRCWVNRSPSATPPPTNAPSSLIRDACRNAGAAATGSYDLQFTVFDALTGGTAQTGKITMSNVAVAGGIFTVPINFGSTLRGNSLARFLEIAVKPSANTSDSFTVLAPRQPLTAAPFAVNAQKAFDVQMVLTNGAPSASDCDSSSKYGQTRVDAASLKLYVCTAAGWKSATLQ